MGNWFSLFWPTFACLTVVNICWIIACFSCSRQTRYVVFGAWVILIVLIHHIYWLVIWLNGQWVDHMCQPQALMELEGTEADCREAQAFKIMIRATAVWVIDAYFGWVVFCWAMNIPDSKLEWMM